VVEHPAEATVEELVEELGEAARPSRVADICDRPASKQ
jgi:hypothetical protein